MKVAVLGGAGQVGLHVVRFLNTFTDMSAIALCRSSLVTGPLYSEGVPFRVYSSSNRESLHQALDGCEAVVDSTFAANSNLRRLEAAEALYKGVCSAPGVQRLIHFSSVAVYGELTAPEASFENPQPDTIYGKQKLTIERLAAAEAKARGVAVSVLRLGHVYGPEMPWSLAWAKTALEGSMPQPHLQKPSNAVHVMQVCHAVRRLLQTRQEGCQNLVGTPNLSWRELFDWHERALQARTMLNLDEALRIYRPPAVRYQAGRTALAREAVNRVKSGAISGLTGCLLTAQGIRTTLAVLPFAPSVGALKAKMTAPNLRSYFGFVAPGEADYVFDSITVPGPVFDSGMTPGEQDREAVRAWLTRIFNPDITETYIEESLFAAKGTAEDVR